MNPTEEKAIKWLQDEGFKNLKPNLWRCVEFSITQEFEMLWEDEDPILWTGLNDNRDRIIGSMVAENDDLKCIFEFRVVASEDSYIKFLDRKKTYRELLIESPKLWLLVKTFKSEIISFFHITWLDIPKEYFPLEDSYCPEQK